MRKAITLIEIIVTLVIASVLSIGMFQALEAVAVLSQKAKVRTNQSLDTQSAIDQISLLMYDRIPNSVVGYDVGNDQIRAFDDITAGDNITILQWIGTFSEVQKSAYYSGFIDMNASDSTNLRLSIPDTNRTGILTTLQNKWNNGALNETDLALVFAGAFDAGVTQNRYGWNNGAIPNNDALTFNNLTNTTLTFGINPTYIYEKYYLADSAYAVARGVDVDANAACLQGLNIRDINNTLLLFYNFQPWEAERFCADRNGGGQDGNATILAEDVTAFRVEILNSLYRISIETNSNVNGSNAPVKVSKQKVVF